MSEQKDQGQKAKRDERFDQLMQLAKDGVEEAIHDLWAEYGYDFEAKQERPADDAQ